MKRTANLGILAVLMVAGSVFAASCGGGSGGGTVPAGRTANFTPAQSPAPANSASMQKGTVSGDMFQIEIRVTDVNDFFGTAFHVLFGSSTARFVSMSSSGSFLSGAGITTDIRTAVVQAGDLEVVATRVQDQAGSVQGVDVSGSQLLLTLTFQATANTGGNTFSFESQEACTPTAPPCTPPISLTWHGGTLTAN